MPAGILLSFPRRLQYPSNLITYINLGAIHLRSFGRDKQVLVLCLRNLEFHLLHRPVNVYSQFEGYR